MTGECHGKHRTLAQPAAELERIGIEALLGFGDPHSLEHLNCLTASLLVADLAVQADGFDDLISDGVDGREGGERLLEDHRDLSSPDGTHLAAVRAECR